MIILVTGGSGSGKSGYAEKLVTEIAKKDRYYIATMKSFDEEGKRKIQRHQKMRLDKNFKTIEQFVDIKDAGFMITSDNATALLECMSNLTANEMFCDGMVNKENFVVDKIVKEIDILEKKITNFVIVTNNVFEDGFIYDEATNCYIKALGRINREIAKKADLVYEVVVGIPIKQKGED